MPNKDHCCVPLCSNNRSSAHSSISYHQFPKDKALKKAWIVKIRRDIGGSFKVRMTKFDKVYNLKAPVFLCLLTLTHALTSYFQITNGTRVCSEHFKPSELKRSLAGKRVLIKDAVPSIFDWSKDEVSKKRKSPKKRECSHSCAVTESVATVIEGNLTFKLKILIEQ